MPERLYTVKDLAKALGKSPSTVWKWLSEGEFKGCYAKIDKCYIFYWDKIWDKYSQQ